MMFELVKLVLSSVYEIYDKSDYLDLNHNEFCVIDSVQHVITLLKTTFIVRTLEHNYKYQIGKTNLYVEGNNFVTYVTIIEYDHL